MVVNVRIAEGKELPKGWRPGMPLTVGRNTEPEPRRHRDPYRAPVGRANRARHHPAVPGRLTPGPAVTFVQLLPCCFREPPAALCRAVQDAGEILVPQGLEEARPG